MRELRTVLISMPWAMLHAPSIQLGIMTSVVRDMGFPVFARSYYLSFMDFLQARTKDAPLEEDRITTRDYLTMSERLMQSGLPEWIFVTPEYNPNIAAEEAAYMEYLKTSLPTEKQIKKAMIMRQFVPEFVQQCALDVLALEPDVVGFTSTFSQNVPSLVLAQTLKRLAPDILTVFGGANCEGAMGRALHTGFPFIDIVLQGEAELAFPKLLRHLAANEPYDDVAGLVFRRDGAQVIVERDADATVPMSAVPAPNYDEYFARLRGCAFRGEIDASIHLPVESSRGCWWGAKHHCTFCGLNGTTMAFRGRDPDAFMAQLDDLSRRYRRLKFEPVDNIIDMRYFETFLPKMAEARKTGLDFAIFYETKANLKKDHLRRFVDAGVFSVQPGIESLSTPILQLMRKGVSGLQNIRLLKWAREYRLDVRWLWLFGFPREPLAEYDRMLELIPSLVHLQPPSITRMQVHRFSPNFDDAEALGVKVLGAERYYKYLYPLDEKTIFDIAYVFEHENAEPQGVDYAVEFNTQIAAWRRGWSTSSRQLLLERGPSFIVIRDRRPTLPRQDYTFFGAAAALYLACDGGARLDELADLYRTAGGKSATPTAEVERQLDEMVTHRLMYREGDVFLGLAPSANAVASYDEIIAQIIESTRTPATSPAAVPALAVAATG